METSTSLLDRLRDSPDDEAWRRLDTLYRPLILRWLLRDPSLKNDADDIAQEIMDVVCREVVGFTRRQTGSFRKWIRTITSYRVHNYYRQRKARVKTLHAGPEEEWLTQLADDRSELARRWDQEHNEHIVQQLLAMVAREFSDVEVGAFRRQVFDLAKPGDVARELQVSLNVVYLAKSRILARLREIGKGLLD
jgi:RNA polymerase sigma-70 factor (ECF subfamily)